MLDAPDLTLLDGIPGDELAACHRLQRLAVRLALRSRILGGGIPEVPPAEAGRVFEALLVGIAERYFLCWQIDQVRFGTVGHRVPVVGAESRRHQEDVAAVPAVAGF